MTRRPLVLALLLAACGSRTATDSRGPHRDADADAAAGAPTGALVVRVEWAGAPAEVRASPGRDACQDPRPPFAAIHTLHGVADAVVWIDGITAGKAPPPRAPARVTLRGCRLAPAVQVAPHVDADLEVTSLVERPVALTIAHAADVAAAPAPRAATTLPVVGHTVALPLGEPFVVTVETDASADPALVIVPPHPYVAVTGATGEATLDAVPAGTHTVRAWLRGAGGRLPRVAAGTITVEPGAEARLTLSIADSAPDPARDPAPDSSGDPAPDPEP